MLIVKLLCKLFAVVDEVLPDVSNNDTYDEIYQKAADMVSSEEISMPPILKHQTMRSNVPTQSSKNHYLRNLYYPF